MEERLDPAAPPADHPIGRRARTLAMAALAGIVALRRATSPVALLLLVAHGGLRGDLALLDRDATTLDRLRPGGGE